MKRRARNWAVMAKMGWIAMATLGLTQAQATEELVLGNPSYSGAGCPSGSAAVTFSPDNKTLSILFDQFRIDAGGNTGLRTARAACNIAVPVRVPAGYTMAVFAIDYRGFMDLPAGARGQIAADYFFAGSTGINTTRNFTGPFTDDFTTRRELNTTVWSKCGADVILRSQTSLAVSTNQRRDPVSAALDSIDISSGIIYQLSLKPCDERPIPPVTPPQPPRPTPVPPRPIPVPTPTRTPTPPPPPPAPVDRSVIGVVDDVVLQGDAVLIRGWACAKTVAQSIEVHVYAGGPAGSGRFVTAARADQGSEGAVADRCQTGFGAHRFGIRLPLQEASAFQTETVWVHGISPVGGGNLVLDRSSEHSLPDLNSNGVFVVEGTWYKNIGDEAYCRIGSADEARQLHLWVQYPRLLNHFPWGRNNAGECQAFFGYNG